MVSLIIITDEMMKVKFKVVITEEEIISIPVWYIRQIEELDVSEESESESENLNMNRTVRENYIP